MASEKSIEIFAKAALSENDKIVDAAFNALKSCNKEALPSLKMMLQESSNIHLMERVCETISEIGPENKEFVSILTKMLANHKGKDTLIIAIINALSSIGPHAKAALPNLYKFIDFDSGDKKLESKPEIQIAVIYAINAIDRED